VKQKPTKSGKFSILTSLVASSSTLPHPPSPFLSLLPTSCFTVRRRAAASSQGASDEADGIAASSQVTGIVAWLGALVVGQPVGQGVLETRAVLEGLGNDATYVLYVLRIMCIIQNYTCHLFIKLPFLHFVALWAGRHIEGVKSITVLLQLLNQSWKHGVVFLGYGKARCMINFK